MSISRTEVFPGSSDLSVTAVDSIQPGCATSTSRPLVSARDTYLWGERRVRVRIKLNFLHPSFVYNPRAHRQTDTHTHTHTHTPVRIYSCVHELASAALAHKYPLTTPDWTNATCSSFATHCTWCTKGSVANTRCAWARIDSRSVAPLAYLENQYDVHSDWM